MKKPETDTKTNAKKEKEYLKIDSYKVLRTQCLKSGSVTFDLELNGVKIYGCFVVEGKNGDFISFPQRKGSDGKYYSIVYAALTADDQNDILEEVERVLNS